MAKFRTRARTVDMLGRQQIAGIPTAISEIFKNAYDAYADSVEVDYFLSEKLFVVRDDGCGMTKQEFEDRWLTLGTESKTPTGAVGRSQCRTMGKDLRPVMGEKGIGRLAIGIIGPQVLILTRAAEDGKPNDLVVAFVHWGLFALPGVNLDQIEIPIRVFPGGHNPSESDIADMVAAVRMNVEELLRSADAATAGRILGDLDKFKLDSLKVGGFFDMLGKKKPGHGTQFYILPASDDLKAELDIDIGGKDFSKLRKLLLGFSNTMTAHKAEPRVSTKFRYWTTDTEFEELIEERQFFLPDDFETADHRFSGSFDSSGRFLGTVRVFKEEHKDHVIPWAQGAGTRTACGPFRIDVAYVMGQPSETEMIPHDHALMDRKLESIGGLYVYRNGIRVLPYGDPGVDFLRFEERRSKGAGYYFFSYRRMFGFIEITREHNGSLAEKAGREGFQENGAYREFKSILESFFIQLARDFFRKGGSHADLFLETVAEKKRTRKALQEREERSSAERRALDAQLERFFSRLNDGEPHQRTQALLDSLPQRIESIFQQADPNRISLDLTKLEARAIKELRAIRVRYRLTRPPDVGLTKRLERDWHFYLGQVERLERDSFVPAERALAQVIEEAVERNNLVLDRRKEIGCLVEGFVAECRSMAASQMALTQDALKDTQIRLSELGERMTADIDSAETKIRAELDEQDPRGLHHDEVVVLREKSQSLLESTTQRHAEVLGQIRRQLNNIRWVRDEEGDLISEADMTAALEGQVIAMREESEENLEVTQLGMAIDVINHEFQSAVKSIRSNLRQLKRWADVNPDLDHLYGNIRLSFDHLDSYLTLFTPLHRRLYRKAVDISGADIEKFLCDLFGKRLEGTGIVLKATQAFREKVIVGYPSTFYPVFINLVDNAIFWVEDAKPPREIILDVRGDDFAVKDTGPGISPRDREAIFEKGFTKKPGGHGLGLWISMEVLRKEGFQLRLGDPEDIPGAEFVITRASQLDDDSSGEAK